MKRFNILDAQTEIGGNHFLEASAGTGKTFTIEHLVCRLIREKGLKIEEILVVTFTRAATRELRQRIRALLQKENLTEAVLSFDGAQIFTIHGFCQKILQEFAFETLAPLQSELWSACEEEKALEAILLNKADGKTFSAAQLSAALSKNRGSFELLKKAVLRAKSAPLASFEEIAKKFSEKIAEVPSFSVVAEFDKAALHYKKIGPHHARQAAALQEMVAARRADPSQVEALFAGGPLFLKYLGGEPRKKKSAPPEHRGLDALKRALFSVSEEIAGGDRVVRGLSHAWREERHRIGMEEGKLSPDDILSAVQECLGSEAFVFKARQNIRAVVVDEFQDTDPVQWQIFETLFKDHDLAAFYLVGDPKQSIYAFRSADVYTYMAAGKSLGDGALGSLDTNWRSVKGLGAQLNRLFCSRPWIDLPKIGQLLDVPAVGYAKEGDGELHFMIAEGHLGRKKKFPTLDMEENCFFPFIAENLSVPLEENAVLVKDRFQARRLREFFKKHGISCSVQRGGSLADSLALELLLELVKGEERKIMAGPFFRRSAEEITQEAAFALKTSLEPLYKILHDKGFAPFFDAFLRFSKSREHLDPELYCDLLDLVEMAAGEGDSARLSSFFEELRLQETEERPSLEVKGVQIMTMHASKGLEFETVFALGLASRTGAIDEPEDIAEADAEKMRQLYVACTRAKKRLFLPVARSLDDKKAEEGCASPMEIFLERTQTDLTQFSSTVLTEPLAKLAFSIPSYSAPQEEALLAPPPAAAWPDRRLLSFSSLSKKTAHFANAPGNILPAGAETGVILHKIFENAFKHPLPQLIERETKGTILEAWEHEIATMVQKTVALPLLDFSLSDVDPARMLHELEFLFPKDGNMLKGFIDLCFEHRGKYYIVDWKSNYLPDYSQEGLAQAMQDGDYFLQGSIYAAALRKYFKYLPFGGAFYIFLRGPASYHFVPEEYS